MDPNVLSCLWSLGIAGRVHHARDLRGLAKGLTWGGSDLDAGFFPDPTAWGTGDASLGKWVASAYTHFISRDSVGVSL